MVVAAHPLAADAGLEVLRRGGNAVDAAVATAFALNVAEPFASGIGGGGFMIISLAGEKKVTVINYREKAPALASPLMFGKKGEENEEFRTTHGLAVAVPGALAGWDLALKKYGTQSLAEAAARAIILAEQGYEISPTFSQINKDEYERIAKNAESTCYFNQGFPYEPGEIFRNPELAATFRILAARGIAEFYKGEIAAKIIAAVKAKGGLMTQEDLASYRPLEVPPLQGTYKNYSLYTIPPPGSGAHLIELLNVIENWPARKWGHNSPVYIHHWSEALRFVFADRARYLGDPEFVSIPISGLLSKDSAGRIASAIRPDRLADSYPSASFDEKQDRKENTTHICVVDSQGNIVSLTQSINDFFGCGIVPEGTGFLLNNQMYDFTVDPDSVNAPNSGRRPASSMSPFILFEKDKPLLALGSPGGTRIFSSLAQIIINIAEFGMSLDEAIEAPRFFSYSAEGEARSIYYESRIPGTVIKALEALGHKTSPKEAYDKYFGGAQGIMILRAPKLIHGGADSRRDGFGAGY
jgi:gamma-glutamyltranspeptidase/glutathione hydrolase